MKFEVAAIPGKGLGLRATQDIKRGELVLKEEHVGRDLGSVFREQGVPPSLLALIVTGQKQDFASTLKNHVGGEISANDKPAAMDLYDPNPEGPADEKMARIYLCNQFAGGLFLTCSRMNHSTLVEGVRRKWYFKFLLIVQCLGSHSHTNLQTSCAPPD
jgi:hypothetical protein